MSIISMTKEIYEQLDKIDPSIIADYVWETPAIIDSIKEWLEEDLTPCWNDRD